MRGARWIDRARLAAALLLAAAAVARGDGAAPFKGLVLWPDEAKAHPELSREISLEFSYLFPSEVVRGFGDGAILYDWTPLERLLDGMASRGHQAILRFCLAYPGKDATGVPGFVRRSPGYKETFAANPNGDGPTRYPDWSHPDLRAFMLRFVADFAVRYDADPRVAFVEVGFGHWAEYHTCGTPLRPGRNFPSPEFQKAFFRKMADSFRQTPWLVSIDAADSGNSPLAADADILALPFGLFDDSFMHREHDIAQGDGYNERCWRAFGPVRWQRAPSGGEISYYASRDQKDFLSPRGLYGVTFAVAAAKYHVTFMIANDAPGSRHATPATFRDAATACGYRFRLAGREVLDDGRVRIRIRNDGTAPLYHEAHPSLGHAVSPESLKGLLPGATLTCDFPATPSSAPLRITAPKLLPDAEIPLDP